MNQQNTIICPVCLKDDRIQRVSSIISSGIRERTTTTAYDADPYYEEVRTATTTTVLARRLAPPPEPHRPQRHRPSPHEYEISFFGGSPPRLGRASTWIFIVCLLLSLYVLLAFTLDALLSPQDLLRLVSPSISELVSAWGVVLGCLVVPLGIAAYIFGFELQRYKDERARFTPQQRKQMYLVHLADWERQVAEDEAVRAQWRQAVSHWANDLYYCRRDDVVFLPGSTGVSPERFRDVLYQ